MNLYIYRCRYTARTSWAAKGGNYKLTVPAFILEVAVNVKWPILFSYSV